MNELNLQVVRIMPETENGFSRVLVTSPVFQAVKQSLWARKNHEVPCLNYIALNEKETWVNQFVFKGISLYVYSQDKKMNFFMNRKQAEACLIAQSLPFDIKKFDLSSIASATVAVA